MGKPGLLWVASRITRPSRLSDARFAEWYENQHIDEVVSLSGVPAAARYEAVPLSGSDSADYEKPTWLSGARWLTLYEMQDVEFRNTREFKGLDGQSVPAQDLLDEVFKSAMFETRFGELIAHHEKSGASRGPAKLVISAVLTPGSAELEKWYEEEHVPLIAECPGYVRTRRYRYVDATVLREFERMDATPIQTEGMEASVLAVHEFEGDDFPMAELQKVDETPWTMKVLAQLKEGGMEAGFFKLKRVYGDFLRLEQGGAKL